MESTQRDFLKIVRHSHATLSANQKQCLPRTGFPAHNDGCKYLLYVGCLRVIRLAKLLLLWIEETVKSLQQDTIFKKQVSHVSNTFTMLKNINFKHTNSAEEPFRHDMVKTHENQVKWNTSQDEDNTVQRSQRCFVEWCYYQVN